MALKVGSTAPDINLKSTDGERFLLSEKMKGKPCIIYFYPKDFTPGCTEEACTFRDSFSEFRDLNIDIFGISRDTVASHLKFKAQHKLPFELLSDIDGKVCKTYDALVPIIGLPKRVTYLLNANHKIVAVYQDMFGARKHIEKMLHEMKSANR